MTELVERYISEALPAHQSASGEVAWATHALEVVHAPLTPDCAALGASIVSAVAEHPQKATIAATCAFACYTHEPLSNDVKLRAHYLQSGLIGEQSKTLQDVSACLTAGAASSTAMSHLLMRSVLPEARRLEPLPGHYAYVTPESRDRALFVPGPSHGGVAVLHILTGDAELQWLAHVPSALDQEWERVMCGPTPPWFKDGKTVSHQTVFSVGLSGALRKDETRISSVAVKPGDIVLVPPGAPIWLRPKGDAPLVAHTTTFRAMPPLDAADKKQVEDAVETMRILYRSNICDADYVVGNVLTGSSFRSGAAFLKCKIPRFTGASHFPLDASLMFDLKYDDFLLPGTTDKFKISAVEQSLIFWVGFLNKYIEALSAVAPELWKADEFERNVRTHMENWLQFARDRTASVKPPTFVKTSTLRSVSETVWRLLENYACRLRHFQKWTPRFSAMASRITAGAFPRKSPLEERRRALARSIKDLQQPFDWAKIYERDKWQTLPGLCEEGEALLQSSEFGMASTGPAGGVPVPPEPERYLQARREDVEQFRQEKLPEAQIQALEQLLDPADGQVDYVAIDRARHALMQIFTDGSAGPYVEPAWAAPAAPAGARGKGPAPKKQKKRHSEEEDEEDNEMDEDDSDDDEEGEDIGDDEPVLGSIVRPLVERAWQGNPPTTRKLKCAQCQDPTILFAHEWCETCCRTDMENVLKRSLAAGLSALKKVARGKEDVPLDDFKTRVRQLQKREDESNFVFDGVDEQAKVKAFKELLDGFAALERDFAQYGIMLARVEEREDLDEYSEGDEDEDDDEDDDEEDEDEEDDVCLPSDYEEDEFDEDEHRARKTSKKNGSLGAIGAGHDSPQAQLALELLRFRRDVGHFVDAQQEMEEWCMSGDEKKLAAARTKLEELRRLPAQWGVEAHNVAADVTQFCDSLGWFPTEAQAKNALVMHVALHRHLVWDKEKNPDGCKFRVVEKKRGAQ